MQTHTHAHHTPNTIYTQTITMQSYSNLDDSKWHVDGFRNNSIRNLFDVCLGK